MSPSTGRPLIRRRPSVLSRAVQQDEEEESINLDQPIDVGKLIDVLIERFPRSDVAEALDNIKDLGFKFATKAGLTIALDERGHVLMTGPAITVYQGEIEL